jgi:hypothetical protein
MQALISLVLLAAATSTAPLKLAAPGLAHFGVDDKLGEVFTEHLADQMKLAGAEVVTQREMAALLGLERQRQLAGCSEQSGSCMAELANALGADGVLLGDVAKVGDRLQVNLKIISAGDGKTLAVFTDNVASEQAALESLTRGANELANQAATSLHRVLTPKFRSTVSLRKVGVAPLAVGAVLAAVSAGLMYASDGNYQSLVHGDVMGAMNGRTTASAGATEQTLGVFGLSLGAAAIVAGVAMIIFGKPPEPAAGAAGGVW